ncbi:unnamed protein product [Rotaria sp. Silwood2]|nr:unnamed protein product [Rotaria sp. Silwood2]CAF3237226.1 unnamed protein product [Rotaria sp. Silwood2]CAF3515627.1 unnamed protein product [Rotaria sp. Silwood2]CAF4872258.1 unnamed protein product [Rotaria sp. Silwood2]
MFNINLRLINSIDKSLIKGLRMILIDTINDIQVSITCHLDFSEEKLSNLVRIICPQSLTIQIEKPFSIAVK